MARRASGCIVATTELNIDSMDTRYINNDKVLLNESRAGTGRATVTELYHQTQLLQRGLFVK
jgi:hypothetical protein